MRPKAGAESCTGSVSCLSRVLAGTQFPLLRPNDATATGVQGSHPLPPERFHEEPWYTTDVRFVGRRVEDPPLASESPRVGEGAYDTVSAFGHVLLQRSPTGQASGGQGASPPCIPARVPWTR